VSAIKQIPKYMAVALVMLIYLFPLGFLLNTALKSNSEFFANPMGLTHSLAVDNFGTAWRRGAFGDYMLNSILYAGAAALLGTLISLLVGFPVSRGYIGHRRLWQSLFVVMLFLPNALVAQFQLVLRLNLYDTRLGYILVMAAGIGVGPLLVAGYVKSIPVELDEAAALDGVGYWRFVTRVLPSLIKPVLSTVFILQAIGVWNDIILATIMLPDPGKSPVTLGLFAFQGTHTSQWSLLAAATIIVALPLLIAYMFLQRYLVASVVGSAVKG
jgi:raffinose/stachyose/melibiose transport system permease protein